MIVDDNSNSSGGGGTGTDDNDDVDDNGFEDPLFFRFALYLYCILSIYQ